MWARAASLVRIYARMLLLICLRRPYKLTLLVSGGCNLRCQICSLWQQPRQAMGVDELRAIWEAFSIKPCWINVSGGEPTLSRELEAILEFLVELRRPLYITLTTNGYVDCSAMLTRVLGRNRQCVVYVSVSIDGEETEHDLARGVRGSCGRAWCTFRRLFSVQASFPMFGVGISTTISHVNYRQAWPFLERVLRARIPLNLNLSQASRYYHNTADASFSRLERAELTRLLSAVQHALPKLSLDSVLKINFLEGAIDYLRGSYRAVPCTSLQHNVLITSDLDVVDCTLRFRTLLAAEFQDERSREPRLRAVVRHIHDLGHCRRTLGHRVNERHCAQRCHTPCEKYVHLIAALLRPWWALRLLWVVVRVSAESAMLRRRSAERRREQPRSLHRRKQLRLVA